jgi:SAM-dependent methyltransferase
MGRTELGSPLPARLAGPDLVNPNPCDLCGGSRFRFIYATHRVLDGPLVRCEGCGLVQVNPPRRRYQVADGEVVAARREAYERQAVTSAQVQYRAEIDEADSELRDRIWAERLGRIERLARGGRLLDIGSDGCFPFLAGKRGWSAAGLQPDAGLCARAGEKYGVELVPATLKEAGFAAESFDVITAFHVIEHVPSPSTLCRQVLRVLRPGGLIVVETPNIATLWFRIFGRRWRQFIPDHYWFFTPRTLSSLLQCTGYAVESVAPVGKAVSLALVANRFERMAARPLPFLHAALRRMGMDRRVVWINPGDIILALARRT